MSVEISDILKDIRIQVGMTQVELAHHSRVSLPSIQNIEAGRGNPSIDTLQALAGSLGLELKLSVKPANWDLLSMCGAPLLMAQSIDNREVSLDTLIRVLREGCLELSYSKNISDYERKLESIQALLLALQTQYPKIFEQYCMRSSVISRMVPKDITGRLIKLRRISLRKLTEIL